jgi:integrase
MKKTTGHLLKRGENFYVSWRFKGKAFLKVLRDEQGNSITNEREAIKAKEKLMAPFANASEVDVLESIAGKLDGRKAEIAKLEAAQHPPSSIGLAWSEFLASPNRPDSGKSTLRQYEFQWQAFADWMQEKHSNAPTLRDVTKEIAEDYAGSLNHGRLSPSTYNKHLNLLTLVFRVLKHKAQLTGNPWEEIQRKRLVTNSRRELTIDELRKVCQMAKGELQTLLAIGLYSGLRLGDCCTLQWGETDLVRGVIRRVPNKTARRNPKPVIVPIHPVLRDMLAATPPDQRREYVLPEMAALYNNRSDMVTDLVQKHFKTCGITLHKIGTGKDGKRAVIEVGFHSLRHSFVSLCRESNTPLSVVESIVGHSSPAMTRHYTHIGELAAGRAVALLPSVMNDSKPEPTKGGQGILQDLQTILKNMSAKNWSKKKSEALKMLAGATVASADGILPSV